MKKLLAALTIPFGVLFGSVNAMPLGLSLGIDGSGSISSPNFALQRNAYAQVLDDLIPTDGGIAVGVWQFSGNVQEEFAFTVIDSQGDKDALLNAVNAMLQLGGSTNIGDTISIAAQAMIDFGLANLERTIIDISTDGAHTFGTSPLLAGPQAISDGIGAINCLGIGPGANCDFETGANSFEILANDFQDFETALRRKIGRETGQVPEPALVLLLGSALLGFRFTAISSRS